jgi:hypothetical protein
VTAAGEERPSGRGQEHRDRFYHTQHQATHVNEATFRDPDERYLLAVLFHQGQVIQIDRSLPPSEQRAEVLLEGLSRPHSLRRTSLGWLVCSSAGGEVVLLNDAFQVIDRIVYRTGWIQDCTTLPSGDLLLIDASRSCLVQLAGPPWRVVSVTPYPDLWHMHRLLEVPLAYQQGFRRAATPTRRDLSC